jgi:elongation factor 1-gamma
LPFVKKDVEDAATKSKKLLSILEKELQNKTYLVGERITLADLFASSLLQRGFTTVRSPVFLPFCNILI